MKGINKKILCLLLLILASFALSAEPLSSWNHDFNPSLMSTGHRKYIELGTSFNASFANSYFGLTDIFQEEFLIDFNQMYEDLGDQNLTLAFKTEIETHSVLTVAKISVGTYATVDGLVTTSVPNGVVEIFADGILMDEAITGSGDVYGRVFSTLGLYGGYRWKDWQFGTKVGAFLPLVYTDNDAIYEYSALAESDGTISADASVTIPLYSLFDLNDMSSLDAAAFTNYLGYHLDLGAVKVKNNVPVYGFHLTGLTISPALMSYKTVFEAGASLTASDLASYEEGGTDPWSTDIDDDLDFESIEDTFEVSLPIAVGGFYRLQGYPRFIDWIGYGELILDNEELFFNGGLSAQGAVFPLSALSLNVGYDRVLWESSLGLRFNVRVIEMGVDVGLSNTRFVKMFSTNGLYANLYMAMGF